MERVIRVMDMQARPHRVFLDLHHILPVFSPEGHAWRWAIRDEATEISALPRWDLDMSFVLEQLREPRGLVMSFKELEQFAARINQLIWGVPKRSGRVSAVRDVACDRHFVRCRSPGGVHLGGARC